MSDPTGYELIRDEEIQEIQARSRLYRHQPTGARILSIESDDTNKVFGITFRTPPANSTGVAHILEHSVLCGSRKYPVKEPFVELLKGSLQTFLNAFTYPDKTCYPVASEHTKDFYHLIDVYLDAVFFPRITRQIFEQEGWHYEVSSADAPLTYKGVVFNEMKGVYSSPEDVLGELGQQSIFPNTTYGVDSGGRPDQIPLLTYEAFKSFHETYYHPSNAYIYFYGDDDPEERLRRLNEFLSQFGGQSETPGVELQVRLQQPVRIEQTYDPGDDPDPKAMFSTQWLWPETTQADINLAAGVLAYCLIGTSASPLRKALIDSGLGEDLTGAGFANYLRQMYFGAGLRGIHEQNIPQAEALMQATLQALAEKGFDADLVAAALNTVEFKLRERNTGGYPRGLAYMLSTLTFWLHDADPLEPLRFEAPLRRLRDRIDRGEPVFQTMVRELLIENPHRSTVVLRPEAGHTARQEAAEKARLAQARDRMSSAELETIEQDMRELRAWQETPDPPEALAALPRLQRSDLTPANQPIPIDEGRIGAARSPVLLHDLFTSGILYVDVGFDFTGLPPSLLGYLPLFAHGLLEMGTTREDFVTLSNRIGKYTGGIDPAQVVSERRDGAGTANWFFLRAKATFDRTEPLLAILRDVLLETDFSRRERFLQILREQKAGYEASIIPGGSGVADTRLRSGFGTAAWVAEQLKGVSYLFFLRTLERRVQDEWPVVLNDLETIRQFLVHRDRVLVNATLPADDWSGIESHMGAFIDQIPGPPLTAAPWHPEGRNGPEGLTIPSQVNYVAKGTQLYAAGYQLHGSIAVIVNFLRAGYLWDRIRVQGGAYGAFCSMDIRSGILSFGSYRDPNLEQTLKTFDAAASYLRETDLNEHDVTQNMIGAIGSIDAYRLPDAKGWTSMVRYLTGETDAFRQTFRDEVRSTEVRHVREFADALDVVARDGAIVVVGSAEAIHRGEAAMGPGLTVTKIL